MTTSSPHRLGLAPRAGRERRLLSQATNSPPRSRPSARRVFFVCNDAHDRHPDRPAHAPRGVPARCARPAAASFLLESVEKGRLGQHSLVGSGSRLVTFEEAEAEVAAAAARSSATSATTTSRRLEPTVPLPADGRRTSRRAVFVVADTLVRFDHARATRRGARRRPGRGRAAARLAPVVRRPAPAAAPRRDARASPSREAYEASVVRGEARDRRGRRVPDRPLPAGGAADRRLRRSALYRALRRVNPSPYLFLLELGAGPRARRLLARDAREARGPPREPEPDRGDDARRARATRSGCSRPRRTAPST